MTLIQMASAVVNAASSQIGDNDEEPLVCWPRLDAREVLSRAVGPIFLFLFSLDIHVPCLVAVGYSLNVREVWKIGVCVDLQLLNSCRNNRYYRY